MRALSSQSIHDFDMRYPTEVTDQAADFVRELIGSGQLAEGEKLPSTAMLAQSWGIPVGSAHTALAALVRDGLLVRQPRKGTFVCRRQTALTAVAIYVRAEVLVNKEASSYRVILAELQRQLGGMDIEIRVVIDPRATPDCDEPSIPLTRLTRAHKVGAVIVLTPVHTMVSWLPSVSRAVAVLVGDNRFPGNVALDYQQMADLCLQSLAEQGCRSVGLLCAMPANIHDPDGVLDAHLAFYGHFTDAASDLGLRIADDWIMPGSAATRRGSHQETGYVTFRKLWQRHSRPDGLVVYPDSYMPGVFLAMTELGVRVPEDLRLAYHRNEQTVLFSPYPATEAVLSEKEIAAALIAQAKKLWAGEPSGPVLIRFRREDRQAAKGKRQ
jgi:DNA-binding LacI/PurR family transcriptional regulator/DNA-binding transcriptional regulator YhcF (GntR family)